MEEILSVWDKIIAEIDNLYDVDQLWHKGFGDWVIEDKYRLGGKTLCTFYEKKDIANLLITYEKEEREKFEESKDIVSYMIQEYMIIHNHFMMGNGYGFLLIKI